MENRLIILDTNVFISSILGNYGFSNKIVNELILPGVVTLCLSKPILTEYREVSSREKFQTIPLFAEKVPHYLNALQFLAKTFEPTEKLTILKDDPDNRLLELAVTAKADFIITGNSQDFSFKEFRGTKIISPREFYEMWQNTSIND